MPLPPAQPAYILRGHSSAIHATTFIRSNARLLTGDAEGWIVSWNLAIKRPVAVWRAHEGAILGAREWGPNKVITHGKDNKLVVWKLSEEDEASMSIVLPVDTPPEPRKQPWLLHVLSVNTMNFCSFAMSGIPSTPPHEAELLIAIPNTMNSETVDIFHIPSSKRIHTLPNPPSLKGGMIMALSIFPHPISKNLTIISGYESGHTTISQLTSLPSTWATLYIAQAHTQPILSLDISPSKDFYLTSSADAMIAKHAIPDWDSDPPEVVINSKGEEFGEPLKVLKTGHAGQQGLRIRDDGKIFGTAGWDGRVRVYGCKGMRELAVLKWGEVGCYAVDFAEVLEDENKVKEEGGDAEGKELGRELAKKGKGSASEQRNLKAKRTHWIAAGNKDGKVSLWDIY